MSENLSNSFGVETHARKDFISEGESRVVFAANSIPNILDPYAASRMRAHSPVSSADRVSQMKVDRIRRERIALEDQVQASIQQPTQGSIEALSEMGFMQEQPASPALPQISATNG